MLTILFAFMLFQPEIASPPTSIPTIEETIQGIEDAEKSLKSFSVTSKIEARNMPRQPKEKENKTRAVATYSLDRLGRSRSKRDEINEATGEVTKSRIEVYDGGEFRALDRFGETYGQGQLSPGPDDRTWQIYPWEYTTNLGNYCVSELLKVHKIRKYTEAECNGRVVALIETEKSTDKSNFRQRFFVDFQRGFRVVKRERLVEVGSDNWVVFYQSEGDDYREAAPGIWVPVRYKSEQFRATLEHPQPILLSESLIVNENWVVNEDFPREIFTLEFPNGVNVIDQKKGTIFYAANITEQGLVDSVAEARTLQSRDGQGWSTQSIVGWITLVIGGVVIVVAMAMLRVKRRRS